MPTITYVQALNEALREEMKVDSRVYLIGEDIGHHSNCGLGAEINARVYEQAPDSLIQPARRLGAKHVPIPPQPSDIVEAVEAVF